MAYQEGFEEPQSDIANDEEHDDTPIRLVFTVLPGDSTQLQSHHHKQPL